jgi:hypothetical protein
LGSSYHEFAPKTYPSPDYRRAHFEGTFFTVDKLDSAPNLALLPVQNGSDRAFFTCTKTLNSIRSEIDSFVTSFYPEKHKSRLGIFSQSGFFRFFDLCFLLSAF